MGLARALQFLPIMMNYAHQTATATHTTTIPIPYPTPPRGVESAIARASAKTGMDFSYLMDKATVESSMDPTAKAKNSSATGLYQFIETTWLQMVRDYGRKYGLGAYAECIDSNCHVKNARVRQAILDLRQDPETAACMAAEYAAQNADALKSRIGDKATIGKTELYLAHFLGAGGATKFIQALEKAPNARAANFFPAEARTNRGVFYDSETGHARSLAEIYQRFAARFDETPTSEIAMTNTKTNTLRPARPLTPGELPEITSAANENADPWVEGTPIASLSPEFIDRLVAAPPRLFDTQNLKEDTVASVEKAVTAEQVAGLQTITRQTTTTSMHHAALLVLAQNYAHEDNDRYNA